MPPPPAGLGLSGLVVGIPAARKAEESANLISRYGGTPLVGPAIEEVPEPAQGILEVTRSLLDARPAWSVHLTGVGTRRWFGVADAGGLLPPLLACLREASIIARGPKTRVALHDYGLEPAWIPPEETSSSIALWLAPQLTAGDLVALQHQGEPARALSQALTTTGARVVEIATYQWTLPADRGPLERLVSTIASDGLDVLLITSAPQLRALLDVSRDLGCEARVRSTLTDGAFVGAIGEVAASALRAEGISVDFVARPARLGALVRGAAEARERVDAKRSHRRGI